MCLDNLDKNLDATKSRLKSLDFKNLDLDKIKVDLTVEKISTGFKNWSQHDGQSRSWSRLVSTVETPMVKLNTFVLSLNKFVKFFNPRCSKYFRLTSIFFLQKTAAIRTSTKKVKKYILGQIDSIYLQMVISTQKN
jgi:hypothetical protein